MLLQQMIYFVAVVDCNSFTEAAEQCYISQSAISQQIQALEKELGVMLLHREHRHFSLTPAGEYFYRQSKVLLDEVEEIKHETIRIQQNDESRLRIGYLKNYSGQVLHVALAQFSKLYPEISIDIVAGTHEELYHLLRFKDVDMILSDQRRAFSDDYENKILLECDSFVEISTQNHLSGKEHLTLNELKRTPCILITTPKQQKEESAYYQNTLGFGGNFLFAENLEEGRLMVLGNRGFLPLENVGMLPPVIPNIKRIPLYRGDQPLRRTICAFWLKKYTNYYIEEFANTLQKLLR
ncbi:LysR family transcriptional regulator [[Eubacterium] hominis]|uniref:LysR family transcriptional regulator n=1 Tax=[Eubacterium] hominis TaxID=2764325 RepID=UPI003A4E0172